MVIWHKHFEQIKLSNEDVLQFRLKRNEILEFGQISHSNKLTIRVILDYIDSELCKKPLMYKIFSAFRQTDANGEINNLLEFTFSIWNICTISEDATSEFLFSLYRGFSDRLGPRELMVMLKDAFCLSYKNDDERARLISEIQTHATSRSLPEFQSFLKAYPDVTTMILEASKLAKQKIFGVDFWNSRSTERASLQPEAVNKVFIAVNPTVYWLGMSHEEKAKQMEVIHKTKRKIAEEQTSRRNFHVHQAKIVPNADDADD